MATKPNGLLIQWGKNSTSINADETQTIPLPTDFPNANYIVIPTLENTIDNRDHVGIRIQSKKYNQFTVRAWRSESISNGTRYVSYIAIGY